MNSGLKGFGTVPPLGTTRVIAPVYLPSQTAGLVTWLRADTMIGFADGDAVAQWDDLSPQSNHAVQTTAIKKPVYKTNIKNGLPVVRFDGVNDALTLNTFSDIGTSTIFIVLNSTGGSSYRGVFVTSKLGVYSGLSGTAWGAYLGGDRSSGIDLTSGFSLITANIRAASDIDLLTNGSSLITLGGTFDSRGGPTVIGAGTTTLQFHMGDIGEVVVYNWALDNNTRALVEAYLNAKWAIY